MDIYYLNSKGIGYVTQITGVNDEVLNKDKLEGKDCVYVKRKDAGVHILKNYPKDIELVIDKEDNIEDVKKEYNLKGNIEIGDAFILHANEKYIVKPLDTLDKIATILGVNREYIIEKNKLKTDKLFVGQILLI